MHVQASHYILLPSLPLSISQQAVCIKNSVVNLNWAELVDQVKMKLPFLNMHVLRSTYTLHLAKNY
jgi:hypothetical protein